MYDLDMETHVIDYASCVATGISWVTCTLRLRDILHVPRLVPGSGSREAIPGIFLAVGVATRFTWMLSEAAGEFDAVLPLHSRDSK